MINYVSYEYTIFFVFLLIGIPALVAMLFKNKHILELGCVVMENKDEIKFNPIYKMDKQV